MSLGQWVLVKKNIFQVNPFSDCRSFSVEFKSTLSRLELYASRPTEHGAPKKNTSHGNEMLPQDTMHLIQRPCYQRGSPCQDPAGNRTTGRSPDHRKETQTLVVWSCLPFIGSGQNHLARHSERGKKTRQTDIRRGGKTTSGNG